MRRTFAVCACAFFAATISGCLHESSSSRGPDVPSNAVHTDERAATVDDLAPNAVSLCLAEVVEIVEHDWRPSDGNAEVRVKLRKVKGSGEFHEVIDIITAYGGGGQGPPPEPPDFLRPDTFRIGGQYWIAFASPHEFDKHPQGVVNFWPKGKDAEVEAVLDEAVRADVYRWSPRYDPETKLVYGRMVDEKAKGDEKQWRIQVKREGKVLWEEVIPGTIARWTNHSWKLDESAAANFPGKVPSCGTILVAETATRLGPKNEFGLSPQDVCILTGYDPETGARLTAKVMRQEAGYVFTLLYREYDPKTGEVEKETR